MDAQNINPMIPRNFTVERVKEETHDTFTLDLRLTNGTGDFPFRSGQFNMLYVFGLGEVPISISGDPANSDTLIHTIREVGSVTKGLRSLKEGDCLGVRGPFGTSWPIEEAQGKDVVILTGGIGLAPLRPAIYQILSKREQYGEIIILYGARTPDDILFRSELEQWSSRLDVQLRVTVDHAYPKWYGTVGVVTILISKALFDPENTFAMVCGPEIMINFSVQELNEKGVDLKNIYVSMERNMKCGIGLCGHCQYGPYFICKDGPVFPFDRIKHLFRLPEI